MLRVQIAVSLGWFGLTAGFFSVAAAGQLPRPRIIWQQELEGEISTRLYLGHTSHPDLSEPNVGISIDSTRANPVSMVATDKWVYLFDGEGQIDRRVPLRRDVRPDEVKSLTALTVPDYIERAGDKKFFYEESAVTDPNGRFYIIRRQKTRGYDGIWTENFRAYNADGSLRFELRNRPDENIYIHSEFYLSPNGEYLVLFDSGWGEDLPAYLDFYSTTTGALLSHISEDDFRQYDFSPFGLTFSDGGSHVILTGFKTERILIFNGQGNLIQSPEGVQTKFTTTSNSQHERKQAVYRQLVDPQAPLDARPKEVRDVKMLPDRKRGVYTSGNTLYLFELQPSP